MRIIPHLCLLRTYVSSGFYGTGANTSERTLLPTLDPFGMETSHLDFHPIASLSHLPLGKTQRRGNPPRRKLGGPEPPPQCDMTPQPATFRRT